MILSIDSEVAAGDLDQDLLKAIDAFARDQRDGPSRPEAIRRILRNCLTERGYMHGQDEGRRPDELNSANDG